jgi:N-acetylglucosaminyl-diphospho-decaprenol L-rhamnosyltransferase
VIYFITVNYNSAQLVQKLINSITAHTNQLYKILIVNNSPEDQAIQKLSSLTTLVLEPGENLGFGRACNLGLKWVYERDSQAIAWLINPDAYLLPNTLEKAEKFFTRYPHLGIVGTTVYEPNGKLWFAGGEYSPRTGAITSHNLFTEQPESDYKNCDWVTGCSLLINLHNFSSCPYFDPTYFLYYEDFDFCRRYANQGCLVVVTDQFSVIHQPSSITNKNSFIKLKHSTFSYLITLQRYANIQALALRFLRLISYALVLLLVKPQVAFGKLAGVILYFKWLQKS